MNKKVLKFSLIFIALGALIITISPVLLDKKKIISSISNKLKNDLGLDVDFGEESKLTFFPSPGLKIKDFDFKDDTNGIDLSVNELEVIATWNSLIRLQPNIKLIKLKSPSIKLKKRKVASKGFTLVNNNFNQNAMRSKFFLNRFNNLEIQNGKVEFQIANKLNILEKLDLTLKNSEVTIIKGDFNYINYQSFFKFEAKTKDLTHIDYTLNQLFNNKNEIFGSGQIKLNNDQTLIMGDFKSEKLNLTEISKLIAQLKTKDVNSSHIVNLKQEDLKFNVNLEIDELLINKFSLRKVFSNFLSSNNNIILQGFSANYLDTKINGDAIYSDLDKKIKGKITLYDFLVKREMMGASKFYLKDALFDCDLSFIFDKKTNKKVMNQLSSEGECIAPSAILAGIDIDKIANRIDNLETFQDFFDLFNKNKMAGDTTIDSINITFKIEDSVLLVKNLTALQKNFKILSSGKYSIYDDLLNFKNDVFIKTKKFKNLPSFSIFINGSSKDYKLSYDFDKIKSTVMSDGINSILKKKKKIVIDPKKFKNLIDKNSKEFKPEKIIDLFLN